MGGGGGGREILSTIRDRRSRLDTFDWTDALLGAVVIDDEEAVPWIPVVVNTTMEIDNYP